MRLCALLLVAACGYDPTPAGATDAMVADAGPCLELGPTCAGDTLRTCMTIGALPGERVCGWGCDDSGTPRCKVVTPSANGVVETDLDPDATLSDVVIGTATIDSGDGTITGVDSSMFAANDHSNVQVFRFKSLHVTGPVKLEGDNAIALVADGAIDIDGVVDGLGCAGGDGLREPGPGGGKGGDTNQPGEGASGGQPSAGSGTCGAGGGGHGGNGGAGGLGGDTSKCVDGEQGVAGVADTDLVIATLVGGSGGAGGDGGGGGVGGGGGGAIQIVSNTSVTITAAALLNLGGCGGQSSGGGPSDSAGGGGAGGTVLIEAPTITIDGAVSVNGGGGGGGRGSAVPGQNATPTRLAATGGPKGGGGGIGGAGAAAAVIDGIPGMDGDRAGGGGGGAGRMRFLVRPGRMPAIDNSRLSPAVDDVPSTTTTGEATVH